MRMMNLIQHALKRLVHAQLFRMGLASQQAVAKLLVLIVQMHLAVRVNKMYLPPTFAVKKMFEQNSISI